MAQPAGTAEPTGPFAAFARPSAMPPVVPGQTFEVRTTFANRSAVAVDSAVRVQLGSQGDWTLAGADDARRDAGNNLPLSNTLDASRCRPRRAVDPAVFHPRVDPGAALHRADQAQLDRPAAEPALTAVAELRGRRRAGDDPRCRSRGCEAQPALRLRHSRARRRPGGRGRR